MNTINLSKLSLLISLLLLFSNCTKKRDDELNQGTVTHDLYEISQFDNREFPLTTLQGKSSGRQSTKATTMELDESIARDFEIVPYTTKAKFMQDVSIIGRAEKSGMYKIKYQFEKEFLTLYKVAAEENIAFRETTYSSKFANGQMLVPVYTYPIKYFKLEKVRDSNGEETHKIKDFPANNKSDATHFRINLMAGRPMQSIPKNDVYLADLFTGQWFYSATIVEKSIHDKSLAGTDLAYDQDQKSVSRIEFKRHENSVMAVNTDMDKAAKEDKSKELNYKSAIEIPVKWIDYRRAKSGGHKLMQEESLDDKHSEAKHWSKRRYLIVDFAKTKTPLSASFEEDTAKFHNLVMTKNFISFTIYYPEKQMRIKYALKKAHPAKRPRIYPKEDTEKFGYISSTKNYIKNYKIYRTKDYDKLHLLHRFMPTDNKIEYFLSDHTPEKFVRFARDAVKLWNHAFKKAQTKISITLNETKRVSIGDLRFNIINIMDTKSGSRVLGYGPTVADSESGEIISATSNVYVNTFRDSLVSNIRNFIKAKLGKFKDIYVIKNQTPAKGPKDNHDTNNVAYPDDNPTFALTTMLSAGIAANSSQVSQQENMSYVVAVKKEGEKEEDEETHENHIDNLTPLPTKCNYQARYAHLGEVITKQCNEVTAYIARLRKKDTLYAADELKVLESCVDKLIGNNILSTLVHEMGHNFGLKHNFMASVDYENFTRDQDGNALAKMSSVMDYVPDDLEELTTPGLYDIAALAYGYNDSIEFVTDGKTNWVKLKNGQSIAQLEKLHDKNQTSRKKYKYCSDDQAGRIIRYKDPKSRKMKNKVILKNYALCTRHDYGENPKEIVEYAINSFNSAYAIGSRRYDKAVMRGELDFTNFLSINYLTLMIEIYHQWRLYLATFVYQKNMYLTNYNKEDYTNIIQEMIKDQTYKTYYEASQKVYEFFSKLTFTPTKFCIANAIEGPFPQVALEFESLRDEIYAETGKTANYCKDALVNGFLKKKNLKVTKSVGLQYTTLMKTKNFMDVENFEKIEIIGGRNLKNFGLTKLTSRLFYHLRPAQAALFVPNFLDNPIFREELLDKLFDRLINGISKESLGLKEGPKSLPFFKTDKIILQNTYFGFIDGSSIPGKLESSSERLALIIPRSTLTFDAIPKSADIAYLQATNGVYLFAHKKTSARPYKLIKKYNQLKTEKAMDNSDQEALTAMQAQMELSKLQLFTLKELQAMTGQEFIDSLKLLVDSLAEYQGPMKNFFNEQLVNAVQLSSFLIKNNETFAPQLLTSNFQVLLQQVKFDLSRINFFQEKLLQAVGKFVLSLEGLEKYRKNKEEYDNQLEMLKAIFERVSQIRLL